MPLIIYFHGPQASGKTTLLKLLHLQFENAFCLDADKDPCSKIPEILEENKRCQIIIDAPMNIEKIIQLLTSDKLKLHEATVILSGQNKLPTKYQDDVWSFGLTADPLILLKERIDNSKPGSNLTEIALKSWWCGYCSGSGVPENLFYRGLQLIDQ